MYTSTKQFTEEQVLTAYKTNISELVRSLGIEMKDEGKVYRIPGNAGLFLFKHGTGYCCQSTNEKGNGIDFLLNYCGVKSKIEAIKLVLDFSHSYISQPISDYSNKSYEEKGEFILPKKADNYRRVYRYLLSQRGIEQQVVSRLMGEKKIFQEADRGNCVFVGFDKNNNARYAARRGTSEAQFRGEVSNSDKSCAFHIRGRPDSDLLFVCESPIDAMSHASILKQHNKDWQKDHTISLGGLSDKALEQFLKDNPKIKRIVFAFDNDYMSINGKGEFENHGQMAAKRMYDTYAEKGFKCLIHRPHLKDFNEDLCELRKNPNINLDSLREGRLAEFIKNTHAENTKGADEVEDIAEL